MLPRRPAGETPRGNAGAAPCRPPRRAAKNQSRSSFGQEVAGFSMSHRSETYGRLPASTLPSFASLRLSLLAMPPPRIRTISVFAGGGGRAAGGPFKTAIPRAAGDGPAAAPRAPEAHRAGARRGASRGHRLCLSPHGRRRRRPPTRPPHARAGAEAAAALCPHVLCHGLAGQAPAEAGRLRPVLPRRRRPPRRRRACPLEQHLHWAPAPPERDRRIVGPAGCAALCQPARHPQHPPQPPRSGARAAGAAWGAAGGGAAGQEAAAAAAATSGRNQRHTWHRRGQELPLLRPAAAGLPPPPPLGQS